MGTRGPPRPRPIPKPRPTNGKSVRIGIRQGFTFEVEVEED